MDAYDNLTRHAARFVRGAVIVCAVIVGTVVVGALVFLK